jgi:putative ABC transport system substrate-binding protein
MKQLLRIMLVATLLLAVVAPAYATHYCIVVSKRISPYNAAYNGIVEVLSDEAVRFDLEGRHELGKDVADEILKQGCDIVIPIGSLALDAVRLQISDKLIVYTMVASPPTALKVEPNVAGIDIETPPGPFLDAIKKMLPNATRVGIVYNPAYAAGYVAQVQKIASRYGIELVTRTISSMKMLPNAVRDLVPRSDVLLMVPDPTSSNRKAFEYMLLESARRGIPLVGLSKNHVRDGALFSFVLDYRDIGKRSGEMARRARESIAAAKLYKPPLNIALVINEKTAKRLGLRIDPSLLKQAVEVYK